jgi:hypothetical protein
METSGDERKCKRKESLSLKMLFYLFFMFSEGNVKDANEKMSGKSNTVSQCRGSLERVNVPWSGVDSGDKVIRKETCLMIPKCWTVMNSVIAHC